MIRHFLAALAFIALFYGGASAQVSPGAGSSTQPSAGTAQAVYVGPVHPGRVVDVIRAAKPVLEARDCCVYHLGYLVSRYHQGQMEIGYLGAWDGKEWYRVVMGGGDVLAGLEDF